MESKGRIGPFYTCRYQWYPDSMNGICTVHYIREVVLTAFFSVIRQICETWINQVLAD